MPVDRGGLRYPIEVVDQFTTPLQNFRNGIVEAGAAWEAFRDRLKSSTQRSGFTQLEREARSAARSVERAGQAGSQAADASDKQARASRRAAAALSAEEAELKKLIRAAEKRAAVAKIQLQRPELFPTKEKGGGFQAAQQATLEERAQKKVQDALDRRAVAERAAQIAQERGIDLSKKKAAALSVEAKLEAELERKLAKRQAREQLQLRRPDLFPAGAGAGQGASAFDAPRAATLQEQAQTRFQKSLQALQLQQQVKELQRASPEFKKAQAALAAFNEEQERASRTGNSLLFTFRRMIGVFAAFAIIRNVAAGFNALVAGAVNANAALETARNGIAGLVLSTQQLTDTQGRVVEGADAFRVAQSISAKQLELLRREALRTSASLEDLVAAFQVSIAPGAQAGLQLDQVRQITVRISQAASALGVAQNQLAEEIRSLLTGTITPRNSRIATALGITNEDVRRARQQGQLSQFLLTKLRAFGVAADAASQNFNVLAANVQEAFNLALLEGAIGLFDELKGLLADVAAGLVVEEQGGALSPNGTVVQAIREISEGLREGVEQGRELMRSLDGQALINIARVIGQGFAIAAQLLRPIVEGLVNAFGNIAALLSPILSGLGLIAGESGDVLATLIEWTVYLKLASLLTGLLSATQLPAVAGAAGKAAVAMRGIAVAAGAIAAPILVAVAALGALQVGIKQATGETVSLKDAVALTALGVARFLTQAVGGLTLAFLGLAAFVDATFKEIARTILETVADALVKLSLQMQAAGKTMEKSVNPVVAALGRELRDLARGAFAAGDAAGEASRGIKAVAEGTAAANKKALADIRSDFENTITGIDTQINKILNRPDHAALLFQNPQEALAQFAAELEEQLRAKTRSGLAQGAEEGFAEAQKKVQSLFSFAFGDAGTGLGTAEGAGGAGGAGGTDAEVQRLLQFQTLMATARFELHTLQTQMLQLNEISPNFLGDLSRAASQVAGNIKRLGFDIETFTSQASIQGRAAARQLKADAEAGITAREREEQQKRQILEITLKTAEAELKIREIQQLRGQGPPQTEEEKERLRLAIAELKKELAALGGIGGSSIGSSSGQSAGAAFGASFGSSATQALADVKIDESIIQSLIVDPDDEEKVIKSFSDLFKNINRIFKENPIGVITGLFGVLAPGAAGGGAGFAHGGLADGSAIRGARPSIHHLMPSAQGYAHGGVSPPRGLDRRDRIPVWVRRREYMLPPEATNLYGERALNALRVGAIDPFQFKALAGEAGAVATPSPSGPGFATGGVAMRGASAPSGPLRAYFVPDERSLRMFLSAGKGAMYEFHRQEGSNLREMQGGG